MNISVVVTDSRAQRTADRFIFRAERELRDPNCEELTQVLDEIKRDLYEELADHGLRSMEVGKRIERFKLNILNAA